MPKQRKTNGLPFTIRHSRIQGSGAFSVRRIRKGQRVVEYIGERISPEEEERRYDESRMDRHHTYLFEVDGELTIDGAVDGNESRFINHSCDPNCEAVNEDGRIFIEAIKNIQPGIELTYDYSYEHTGRITKKLMEFYKCMCGSDKCRGTILKVKRNGNHRKRTSSGKK